MNRTGYFSTVAALVALLVLPLGESLASAQSPELLTLDTHVDIPSNYATPMVNPADAAHEQVTLDKMKAGGLKAAFFIVYVDQAPRNAFEYEAVKKAATQKFDAIHRMVDENASRIELAGSAADVERIAKTDKRIALIGVENGFAIGQDISLLKAYHERGARYMTLVHNGHNDIGDSAAPSERFGDKAEEHGGLSPFGQEVIREMNRLGIMVDVSHVSKKTMMQATHLSKAPVIASHSSVRALADHVRNLDDEQLQAIRDAGGVVQITAVDPFLVTRPDAYEQAVEKIRAEMGLDRFLMERLAPPAVRKAYHKRITEEIDAKWPRATVRDLIDHVDYAVDLIGIDHVGLSSDFDGGGGILGWDDASETPNVTAELKRRGYSTDEIEKIWGGNLLRVMKAAEAAAR